MIDSYQIKRSPFVYILHCTEIITLEGIKIKDKEEVEMGRSQVRNFLSTYKWKDF
jgi:Tfp pilus assembly protein PilO